MKSVFYLMDKYPYNQAIKDEIYSLFYYFSLNCIAHKEQEIKTILYDNYWSKKRTTGFSEEKEKSLLFDYSSVYAISFYR